MIEHFPLDSVVKSLSSYKLEVFPLCFLSLSPEFDEAPLFFFFEAVDEIFEFSVVAVDSKQCFSQVVHDPIVEVVDDVVFLLFFQLTVPLLKHFPVKVNVVKHPWSGVYGHLLFLFLHLFKSITKSPKISK